MVKANIYYNNLKETYLFSMIGKKVKEYTFLNPDKKIIRMGIGDVTLPLSENVVDAMKKASEEQLNSATFRGYGPEFGYDFLRDAIKNYYKREMNIEIDSKEIFVGDGAKSDVANITDIFSDDNLIVIPDPVYPVYLDTNVMRGRKISYIKGNMENGFLPMPSENLEGDIFYLCSPNNPTGAVYSKEQLEIWVKFAISKNSVILYDSAYESFIKDRNLPRSIYEIEGAKKCAIEFNSFSKTAGFTGVRCGYTVVPNELIIDDMSLNKMWARRQSTKFNGVSYIVQRGAEAAITYEGYKKSKEKINYYMENASIMANFMKDAGIEFTGGENSPYIWFKCPSNMSSWEMFDFLLENVQVVGTPGEGFGKCGEGYFRLTSFNTRENTEEAILRLRKLFIK